MIPVREGLFNDVGRLLGGRCGACTRVQFPAATTCPYCGTDDIARTELSPTGTLWAWTAVTTAPPGYDGPIPYGFGVVELPEGVRVITLLTESDPTRLTSGQTMRSVIVPLHDDVVTYGFAP